MKKLILSCLFILPSIAAFATEPQLLVEAADHPWLTPIFASDDKAIAFTIPDKSEIWSLDLVSGTEPVRAVHGDSIGRRFIFEPGQQDDRVVYRVRVNAHPQKPVRLLSTSIYVFDPVTRTTNLGDILGPYVSEGRLLYRHALDTPLLDAEGQPRIAGPYLNRNDHKFWVLDADSNRIYESPALEPAGGFEISPDGRYVAVVASASSPLLYLIDLQTGERRELGAGRWPAWSGDGRHLSCLTEIQTKRVIRVHHIEEQEFTPVDLPLRFRPESPALNRDGTRVLFVDRGSIYAIDVP